MATTKDYSNGEMTVHWEASKCWHFGACVRMLPEVYDPEAKPWIQPENASTSELKKQIEQCPSGALSYSIKNKTVAETKEASRVLDILENGPFTSKKEIHITYQDGTENTQFVRRSYCRCGTSNNLPYCNGNHNKIDFKAAAHIPE